MTSILFVDDEPKILRGLERLLSDLSDEWDMAFAESGHEALSLLEQRPFDVVVSDMRMPGMDGAALLQEVMKRCPNTVRIVLSGHSDRELILRSVVAAHQYLAKPCDREQLCSVVARATALRRILTDDALRSIVSSMTTVPCQPQLYVDVCAELGRPDGSIKTVGEIISKDVAMTAKVLQIVNSAFFGLPRHVTDPAHAASLLGLDTFKALILSAHIFTALRASVRGLSINALWKHCIETGTLARRIASAENCDTHACDHAMMAGLLHDAGKLVLAVNYPERYEAMLDAAATGTMTPLEAERAQFGTTHAEVGAYLFGLWGLPDPIVEAVAFHHRPADCAATTFTPLAAVHVADALEHQRRGATEPGAVSRLDTAYLTRLGLHARLSTWRELSHARVQIGAPA